MKHKLLFLVYLLTIVFAGCEVKIESGKFSCKGIGDNCPDGLTCAATGNTDNYKCYDNREFVCGDGIIQEYFGETCDGILPDNAVELCGGMDIIDISCTERCNIQCGGLLCGDNVATGDEVCDGTSFKGNQCSNYLTDEGTPFHSGELGCATSCDAFIYDDCNYCGNQTKDGTEDCDGNDVGGTTCFSLGHYDLGSVSCNSDCTYNISNCVWCGNGIKDSTELCDGNDFGTINCKTHDDAFGLVDCNNGCDLDRTNCYSIKQWGTPLKENGKGVVVDSLDNIYVVSSEDNPFNITLTKYDNLGTVLWKKSYGNSDKNEPHDMVIDSEDNIYIIGGFENPTSVDGSLIDVNSDKFLFKINTDGTPIWKVFFNGENNFENKLTVDGTNVYVLEQELIGFQTYTVVMFFQKQNGDRIEAYTYDDNSIIDIEVSNSGKLYYLSYNNDISKLYLFNETSKIFDSVKTFSSMFDKYWLRDIFIDNSQNIYLSGWFSNQANQNFGYVVKLDSSHNIVWSETFVIQDADIFSTYKSRVTIDSNSNVYMAGEAKYSASNSYFLYLKQFTSDGTPTSEKLWGVQNCAINEVRGLAVDSFDYIYFTGSVEGSLDGTSYGGEDTYLIGTPPSN
jgi:hypothetical protein